MKQMWGGILLAIGLLIAGASGLCSLYFLVGMGGEISLLPAILIFGGAPFAIGVALVLIGRMLIREGRAERKPDLDKISDVFE